MTTREKILKVLTFKGISLYEATRQMGLGAGTLHKVVERNSDIHQSTKEKFIRHFHVNEAWWDTGKGEMLLPLNDENHRLSKVEEAAALYELQKENSRLKELLDAKEESVRLLKSLQECLERELQRKGKNH